MVTQELDVTGEKYFWLLDQFVSPKYPWKDDLLSYSRNLMPSCEDVLAHVRILASPERNSCWEETHLLLDQVCVPEVPTGGGSVQLLEESNTQRCTHRRRIIFVTQDHDEKYLMRRNSFGYSMKLLEESYAQWCLCTRGRRIFVTQDLDEK